MIEYLNKPFPFIENKLHRLIASFLFALFIFIFIYIFQPFGISNIQYNKGLYLLGYFGITASVMLLGFFVAPLIFKDFFNFENWTIKKNYIFISIHFLLIIILNWIYNTTIGITEQHSLLYFILITVSVGIFPTLFLMYFIEKILTNKSQSIATTITDKIQHQKTETINTSIQLVSKNNNETFTINLHQLICIKSEGNYLSVVFKDNNKIESKLIRNSISKIEEQLIIFEKVVRCHRSYIVNLGNVEKLSGNARNFSLHITDLDYLIPVSRSFPNEIFKRFDL